MRRRRRTRQVEEEEEDTETRIVVEAGEPTTLLLKAELPARRHKLSKPDSQGSSIIIVLTTPTWMPRR